MKCLLPSYSLFFGLATAVDLGIADIEEIKQEKLNDHSTSFLG
jgi:hypothetical protein